jgi:hypothetical protein
MNDVTVFGSGDYIWMAVILAFTRGMDFLSTWVATPNLVLEANPIARKLGWKWGLALNVILCGAFAFWPLPAVVIATTSVMVAVHNFQSAWLMRTLGESGYQDWMGGQLRRAPLGLYLFCLLAQTVLISALGGVLIGFSGWHWVPMAIGLGMIAYALAVTFYTLLSVWRIRRYVD